MREHLTLEEQRFFEADWRFVVAVDPPASASAAGSCCGIVVAGRDANGRAVVLEDGSVAGESPAGWARAVVRLFRRFDADRVVAEVNQGGDMVAAMLKSVEANLSATGWRRRCGCPASPSAASRPRTWKRTATTVRSIG